MLSISVIGGQEGDIVLRASRPPFRGAARAVDLGLVNLHEQGSLFPARVTASI